MKQLKLKEKLSTATNRAFRSPVYTVRTNKVQTLLICLFQSSLGRALAVLGQAVLLYNIAFEIWQKFQALTPIIVSLAICWYLVLYTYSRNLDTTNYYNILFVPGKSGSYSEALGYQFADFKYDDPDCELGHLGTCFYQREKNASDIEPATRLVAVRKDWQGPDSQIYHRAEEPEQIKQLTHYWHQKFNRVLGCWSLVLGSFSLLLGLSHTFNFKIANLTQAELVLSLLVIILVNYQKWFGKTNYFGPQALKQEKSPLFYLTAKERNLAYHTTSRIRAERAREFKSAKLYQIALKFSLVLMILMLVSSAGAIITMNAELYPGLGLMVATLIAIGRAYLIKNSPNNLTKEPKIVQNLIEEDDELKAWHFNKPDANAHKNIKMSPRFKQVIKILGLITMMLIMTAFISGNLQLFLANNLVQTVLLTSLQFAGLLVLQVILLAIVAGKYEN